jgi:hypothetical protein
MTRNNQRKKLIEHQYGSELQYQKSVSWFFDTLAKGQLISLAIAIVARLRIADYLKENVKTIKELAEVTNVNPDALYRLLRMLASVGIFSEINSFKEEKSWSRNNESKCFELTPMASLLCSDTKNSIRDFALLFGLDSFNKATINLSQAIATGENSFKYANGLEMFDYLQQKKNMIDAKIFDNAMNTLNVSFVSLIFRSYKFSQFETILDIGGGQGLFLASILKKHPEQFGILFDLPHVIRRAKMTYWADNQKQHNIKANHSLISRCKLLGGNFFNAIPYGADCYMIKNVLLNWDDESAAVLLRNCLQSMTRGDTRYIPSSSPKSRRNPKLLIIETIMPEGNGPFLGKFTDVLMLVLTRGGKLRTEAEFAELLDSCGFKILNIFRPPGKVSFLSIIEAIPKELT